MNKDFQRLNVIVNNFFEGTDRNDHF